MDENLNRNGFTEQGSAQANVLLPTQFGAFNAKKMLEARLLNGGAPSENKKDYTPDEEQAQAAAIETPQPQITTSTPEAPSVAATPMAQNLATAESSIVVKIKPKKTTIEISFRAENPKGVFTIKLPTVDTTIAEDSITAIILPEVDIVPPTLVPLTIKVHSVTYDVIYAGATCTLNTLRFMSFVRIQQD